MQSKIQADYFQVSCGHTPPGHCTNNSSDRSRAPPLMPFSAQEKTACAHHLSLTEFSAAESRQPHASRSGWTSGLLWSLPGRSVSPCVAAITNERARVSVSRLHSSICAPHAFFQLCTRGDGSAENASPRRRAHWGVSALGLRPTRCHSSPLRSFASAPRSSRLATTSFWRREVLWLMSSQPYPS